MNPSPSSTTTSTTEATAHVCSSSLSSAFSAWDRVRDLNRSDLLATYFCTFELDIWTHVKRAVSFFTCVLLLFHEQFHSACAFTRELQKLLCRRFQRWSSFSRLSPSRLLHPSCFKESEHEQSSQLCRNLTCSPGASINIYCRINKKARLPANSRALTNSELKAKEEKRDKKPEIRAGRFKTSIIR